MNPESLTWLYLAAMFLGDVALVRWILRRDGTRASGTRMATWLFLTGFGIAGIVGEDAIPGRHPILLLVAALACGAALGYIPSIGTGPQRKPGRPSGPGSPVHGSGPFARQLAPESVERVD